MKDPILSFLLITVLLFIPLVSCEKDIPEDIPGDPVPIELNATELSLSESSNDFSFDIFRLLMNRKSEVGNIMISPLSISYALSMTLNGANGETRSSMMEALRTTDLSMDEINESYLNLSEKITGIDKRVVLDIANSVWVEDRLNVKQEFINALVEYFKAEGKQFNINDPDIVDEVNSWISDHTNGKIDDMIEEIPADVVMLLINAIYFNGKWKYKFDESQTSLKPFYLAGDQSVDVDMMVNESTYKVAFENKLSFIELPYGQGNFVMDVILPAEGYTAESILEELSSENFNNWANNANALKVNLQMPRFKYEYKIELKDVLSAMGMGIAFGAEADFSNISDQDLFISKVLHQTYIDNKEEGTEAAAATVVMIELTSAGPDDPLVIKLDKPFYYIIRESTTNTIIFMGLTANPAAS
ncbi:MAG: serpin family protein [Marinilabiliaceae bacterium]|jgi:serpin B|nr:serpin family protein [Marinilabiliaceae bacterium]